MALAIDNVAVSKTRDAGTAVASDTITVTGAANAAWFLTVATGGLAATAAASNVTSTHLTWVKVGSITTQNGPVDLWRSQSASALTSEVMTVTFTASQQEYLIQAITITGADLTGTNGSAAVGATNTGNGASGAQTQTLTTTRNNSWVWMAGNDWDASTARTIGSNQTMVKEFQATVNGSDFWVQRQTNTTAASGTVVTMNDTLPTADRWNIFLWEIMPAVVVAGAVPVAARARLRAPAAVRARKALIVPAQESPVAWRQPEEPPLSHARLAAFMRGRRTFVVPPQIPVPPTIPGNRRPAIRCYSASGRGRRWWHLPGEPRAPSRAQSRPRIVRAPRGTVRWRTDLTTVPPPRAPRRMVLAPTRGKPTRIVLAPQTVPVIAWPPPKLGAPRRLLAAPTRGRQWRFTPAQVAVPSPVWPTRVPRRRALTAAPRSRVRWTPSLVPSVSGAPCITPPTSVRILPYASTGVVADYESDALIAPYTSTSVLVAYLASAIPSPYTAKAGIVAYTGKAAVVKYSSAVTFGPTYCP